MTTPTPTPTPSGLVKSFLREALRIPLCIEHHHPVPKVAHRTRRLLAPWNDTTGLVIDFLNEDDIPPDPLPAAFALFNLPAQPADAPRLTVRPLPYPLPEGSSRSVRITRNNLVGIIGWLAARSAAPPAPRKDLDPQCWKDLAKPARPPFPFPWNQSSRDLHDCRLWDHSPISLNAAAPGHSPTKATLTVFMTHEGTWRWRTSKPTLLASPTEYENPDDAKTAAENHAFQHALVEPFPLVTLTEWNDNLTYPHETITVIGSNDLFRTP